MVGWLVCWFVGWLAVVVVKAGWWWWWWWWWLVGSLVGWLFGRWVSGWVVVVVGGGRGGGGGAWRVTLDVMRTIGKSLRMPEDYRKVTQNAMWTVEVTPYVMRTV